MKMCFLVFSYSAKKRKIHEKNVMIEVQFDGFHRNEELDRFQDIMSKSQITILPSN